MKAASGSAIGIVIGAMGLLVLAVVAALVFIYSGAYNIAATEEHASLTRWAFDTTFHKSVEARANAVAAPGDLAALTMDGAAHYRRMCEHCHGAPGTERAEWAGGMRPRPPRLQEAASEWEASEVFWLVKHGAKMTGMPAFGPTHDDRTLWSFVAFVKAMPAMSPQEYATSGDRERPDGRPR
jgi:mono/diheme cytochrome c family protein